MNFTQFSFPHPPGIRFLETREELIDYLGTHLKKFLGQQCPSSMPVTSITNRLPLVRNTQTHNPWLYPPALDYRATVPATVSTLFQSCFWLFFKCIHYSFKYMFSLFSVFLEQRTTQQGQVYFLHTQTGVSTWHDPRVPR